VIELLIRQSVESV